MPRAPWSVLVIVFLGCGPPSYPAAVPHALLGRALPELHHIRALGGQKLDAADLAGHPVVVKFFAQYCAPCMVTLPEAERIHHDHADVIFLGVDEDEGAEAAQALVARFGLTFPVVHDTSNVLSGRFRVATLPATFVADRSGVVQWVGGEGQTGDDLERAVAAAASSPVPAPAAPANR